MNFNTDCERNHCSFPQTAVESELELVRTQLREKSEQYQSLQVVSREWLKARGRGAT